MQKKDNDVILAADIISSTASSTTICTKIIQHRSFDANFLLRVHLLLTEHTMMSPRIHIFFQVLVVTGQNGTKFSSDKPRFCKRNDTVSIAYMDHTSGNSFSRAVLPTYIHFPLYTVCPASNRNSFVAKKFSLY